jgi:tetratricopeptide (TPR) repeat protein
MALNRSALVGRWLASAAIALLVGCASNPDEDKDWFDGGPMKPTTVRTLQMTLRVLAAKGEKEAAGQVAARMLAEYPQHAESYVEAADLLVNDGRYQDASALLTKGLERLPGHPVLHNNRGLCLLLAGKLVDATRDFEAAYAADSYDSDFVGNLALARALSGDAADEAAARRLWQRVLPPDLAEENLAKARSARAELAR